MAANQTITNVQARKKLFGDQLLKDREQLVLSLQNVPSVIKELKKARILNKEDEEKINNLPTMRLRKQELFQWMARQEFGKLSCSIGVLKGENPEVASWLSCRIEEVFHQFPLADGETKSVSLERDSTGHAGANGGSGTDKDKKHSCTFTELVNAIPFHTDDFKTHLTRVTKIEDLKPCENPMCKKEGNSERAQQCLEAILTKMEEDFERKDDKDQITDIERKTLLNEKDSKGQTVLHLAAKNRHKTIVENLYKDYNLDLLMKSESGHRALDLIYTNLPKVAWNILNRDTMSFSNHKDFDDVKEFEIDFQPIIGYPTVFKGTKQETKTSSDAEDPLLKKGEKNLSENYKEMFTLKRYIESDTKKKYELLSHVMIKLFVDLKWKKMRRFLYAFMAIKFLIYVLYAGFIWFIFLDRCPITMYTSTNSSNFTTNESRGDLCEIQSSWKAISIVFLIIGMFLSLIEVWELLILKKVQPLCAYLKSFENLLQLGFYISSMLSGWFMVRVEYIPRYLYTWAAINGVLALTLIFIEGGYVIGRGKYIVIFGKIVKRIGKIMLIYIFFIFSFSFGLCILLGNSTPFGSIFKSFAKVLTMMTGELDYENTMYGDESRRPLPFVEIQVHILFMFTVLLVSLALSNTLTGLAVDDVMRQQKRSQVLLLITNVDKLFTLETILLSLGKLHRQIKSRICKTKEESETWSESIFLIPRKNIWDSEGKPTSRGMVHKVEKNKLNPKLLLEIVEFTFKREKYQYMDNLLS